MNTQYEENVSEFESNIAVFKKFLKTVLEESKYVKFGDDLIGEKSKIIDELIENCSAVMTKQKSYDEGLYVLLIVLLEEKLNKDIDEYYQRKMAAQLVQEIFEKSGMNQKQGEQENHEYKKYYH